MHEHLLNDLEKMFHTRFAVKMNSDEYIPEGIDVSDFKDYFSFECDGVRRSVYVKEKVLSSREKELILLLLKKHFAGKNVHRELIQNEYAYRDYTNDLSFPLKIWEVKMEKAEEEVYQVLQSLFPEDTLFYKDEETLILFAAIKPDKELATAHELYYQIEAEAMANVCIYVSYEVEKIEDLYGAYQNLGKMKDAAKMLKLRASVYEYEHFLLPYLIYQVKKSEELVAMKDGFIKTNSLVMDEELLETAVIFLENNLNITEAASKLYIHRNTLIYRLTKIESLTGYDIRKFSDALNFYLSFLIKEIIVND